MHCIKCRCTFCLYCRSTFQDTKTIKANDACHNHIFQCAKGPIRSSICTDSVLFPANDSDKDFISCYQNCYKLALLQQTVCGHWSALEIKRLVLNVGFQGLLVHLKERQAHYRRLYPEKKDLLRLCFHKTIGATEEFQFDVSSGAPAWSSDDTEEDELRWKLRSEAKLSMEQEAKAKERWAQHTAANRAAGEWAAKRANAITKLVAMGFELVQATHALEATLGDFDAAIAMLVE